MVVFAVVALWAVIGAGAFTWLRISSQRERTYQRFEQATRGVGLSKTFSSGSKLDGNEEARTIEEFRGGRRLSRPWIWLPWVAGVGIAATSWIVFRWPLQYVIAIGAVASLLLSQLESFLHTRHVAILERQLADAIDIMVGAVSAGAGVGPAIEAATIETDRPSNPILRNCQGAFVWVMIRFQYFTLWQTVFPRNISVVRLVASRPLRSRWPISTNTSNSRTYHPRSHRSNAPNPIQYCSVAVQHIRHFGLGLLDCPNRLAQWPRSNA